MKTAIRITLLILKIPIDIVLSVIAVPSALALLLYRRIGSARAPWTTNILKIIGLFPIRKHYYEPLFDDSGLKTPLSDDRDLPGINLNISGQLCFTSQLSFSSELVEMEWNKKSNHLNKFYLGNGSFESGDAEFLYQFVRAIKPQKIIEIGGGNSTKITAIALRNNYDELKIKTNHICIEPYEMRWLEKLGNINVIRKCIEDCDFNWNTELSAGDLLFIDSSHIIRPQGDVLKEYLEIFPRLTSGVYIHIHDIFTPKDYLHQMVVKDVRFWNEQYLLEALLSNTERYEIVAAVNYLKHHYYDQLKSICPYLTPEREPGSFYIRVR